MRRVLTTVAALALTAGGAFAGGVERSTQSVAILFEEGRYAELTFGYVEPNVSGSLGGGALASGDMLAGYVTYTLGYKQALTENIDVAIILDQPIGANIDYPGTLGPGSYPLAGTTADLSSTALTAVLRYRLPNNFSVIGGLRAQQVEGVVSIPVVGGYTLDASRDLKFGYVLGVAWERPEIAARVALTYNSAITHELSSTEFGVPTGTFETEVPQSVNLEFQTGIAADTLLFGSIRWVEWSAFEIDPTGYPLPEALVSYDSDRITYNLGIGRRFNETWSGAVLVAHEPSNGDITGNLGPTDGFSSLGLAATYTMGNMKITGGIRYIEIGDATTPLPAEFEDNDGWGVGLRIGYSF